MTYRDLDKQAIKENAYTALSKITIVGTDYVFTEENGITNWNYEDYRYVPDNGFIGQFVERLFDGTLNNVPDNVILEDTQLNLQLGIDNKLDGKLTWYDYGNFLVTEVKKEDTTGEYSFKSSDYTKYFNKPFDNNTRFPCISLTLLTNVCGEAGVSLAGNCHCYYYIIPNEGLNSGKYKIKVGNTYYDFSINEKLSFHDVIMFIDSSNKIILKTVRNNKVTRKDITYTSSTTASSNKELKVTRTMYVDFPNNDFVIENNQYDTDTSLREIAKDIGKLAYSWVRIGEDNKLHIDFTTKKTNEVDTYDTLSTDEYYTSKKNDLQFGPVNKVLIGMSEVEGENLYATSDDYTEETESAIKIYDNRLTYTEELRAIALNGCEKLYGIVYNPITIDTIGHPWLNGDELIKLTNTDDEVIYTYPFNRSISYSGYIEGSIGSETSTAQNSDYEYKSDIIRNVKKTSFVVDKQNQTITALVEKTEDNESKISELIVDTDGIRSSVDSLNNDYQQTINTKTQATGYPIYINDAGNYNAEELIVYGNSYQDGTPTVEAPKKVESIQIITNLFGSELEQGGINTNGNLFETTTRIRTKDLIEVNGKQMIFSFKGNLRFGYACYDTNGGLLGVDSTWKDSGTIFTPLANTKYLKLFFSNKSDVNANVSVNDVSDIQLEYGSIAHDYVPYGTWLVTKTRGKNLLNYLNINPTGGGSIVNTLNEDGSITTTGKPNADYSKVMPITRINNLLVNGEKYTFSTKEKNTYVSIQMRLTNKETGAKFYLGGANYQSMVFTANTDLYDYVIYIQLGLLANYPEAINVTNFYQLEKGDKPTDFEKFEEHTSLTDLNIYDDEGNVIGHHELLKIGNICDEVDIVTGKLIKRIGKYVVTGDENKSNTTADYQSDNCYSMYFRNNINIKSREVLCNYFGVDSSGVPANFNKIPNLLKTIGATNAQVVMNFPKPLVNNLTEATNWFKEKYNSDNPVEIYYQLQEPVEYQVRTQPLELFEDINTIFVNSDIPPYRMDLTYLTKSTLNGTYATHNELKMTEDSISSTLNKKIMDEKGKTISEVEINTKQQIKDNNEAYVSTEITRQTTDAINNLKIGGRNLLLNTDTSKTSSSTTGTNQIGGLYAFSSYFNTEYKPKVDTDGVVVTCSFDWETTGTSGTFYVQLNNYPYTALSRRMAVSSSNKKGHSVLTVTIKKSGNNATLFNSVVTRRDNMSASVKISNMKIESGNKATDWSQAPEDVDSQFETITTQTNDIKQEVTDTKNSISIKVSEGIEKLQIGGTNLGRKGCISACHDGDTNITLTTTNFSKDGSFEFKRIKNTQNEGVMLDRYVDYEVNKHYIIHFDLKLANNTSGSTINRYFNVYNGLGHKNSRVYVDGEVYKDSSGNEVGFTKNILVPDGNYHNIRLEFDAVSSSVDKDKINTNHIILQPYKQDTNLYTAQVKKFKIEKGDKPTDWSPAPDDKLDTSKFTKAEILTEINNGVSSITLDADVINSTGLTTFMNNKLKNAGQTTINGANITTGKIKAQYLELSDYLTIGSAEDTYLDKTGASNTYLTKSSASSTYATNAGLKNGTTTISGGCITTGTIDASKVSVTNLNASNIKSGTISADKISGGTLTGVSLNINNKCKIDSDGKFSCTGGTFSGDVVLTDGSKLISDKGVLTNLQFNSNGPYDGFTWLGFTVDGYKQVGNDMKPIFRRADIPIIYHIPDDFTVTSAYVVLQTTPIEWEGAGYKVIGLCYDVKLYSSLIDAPTYGMAYDSGYSINTSKLSGTNTNALNYGYNENDYNTYDKRKTLLGKIQTGKSTDIASYLKNKKNGTLFLRSLEPTTNVGNEFSNAGYRTALGKATLIINGYTKL